MKKNNLMNTFQKWMEEKAMPVLSKFANQKYVKAIKNGMALLIPITIIGGLSILIAVPPLPADLSGTNIIFKLLLAWKEWANTYSSILMIPYNLTIGMVSIYVVVGIAYELAVHYKMNKINNTVCALLVFLCISAYPENDGVFSIAQMGSTSMFLGIILAIVVVEINHLLIEKNICIKMPKSVPANVAAPFNLLIPLIVDTLLFMILNVICISLTGSGMTQLVYILFQPLLSATGSLPSLLFLNALATTFWFFGVHGANMTNIVLQPLSTLGLSMNAQAYASGQPLPAIFAGQVNTVYGVWMTHIAMLIVMLICCKSKQNRSVARVSAIPCLFNINEPMIFGIPTVLNVFTYIPMIICGIVNFTTAYLLMSANIIGRPFVTLPFTVPAPLNAFLSSMDWKAVVVWFILMIVDCFIMFPFMKYYDNQLLAQEKEEAMKGVEA